MPSEVQTELTTSTQPQIFASTSSNTGS